MAVAVVAAGCGSKTATTIKPTPPPPATLPIVKGVRLFVSVKGSDRARGDRAHPFRTIQHAANRVKPGQTIVVTPGTYDEDLTLRRSGTPTAPVRLTAAGSVRPLLRGRLKVTASNAIISGLIFEGRTPTNPTDVAVYISGGRRVELDRNEIRNAAQSGVFVGEGAVGVRITRNWIHDNGLTGLDHGIYFENGTGGVIANNLIDRNSYGFGIQLYPNADGLVVTQNTIVRNGRSGIVIGGEATTADRNLVVNNILALNHDKGIRTYWGGAIGNGNVAENNLVGDNGDQSEGQTEGLDLRSTIDAPPGFVDPAAGDFTLLADSPAVDTALASYSELTDFNRVVRPQGNGPDIGAFERREDAPVSSYSP